VLYSQEGINDLLSQLPLRRSATETLKAIARFVLALAGTIALCVLTCFSLLLLWTVIRDILRDMYR